MPWCLASSQSTPATRASAASRTAECCPRAASPALPSRTMGSRSRKRHTPLWSTGTSSVLRSCHRWRIPPGFGSRTSALAVFSALHPGSRDRSPHTAHCNPGSGSRCAQPRLRSSPRRLCIVVDVLALIGLLFSLSHESDLLLIASPPSIARNIKSVILSGVWRAFAQTQSRYPTHSRTAQHSTLFPRILPLLLLQSAPSLPLSPQTPAAPAPAQPHQAS